MSRSAIIEMMTERVRLVGPIPRSVFQSEGAFQTAVSNLEANAHKLFDAVQEVSISKVPSGAKDYIAPFVDDETVVPYILGDVQVPYSLRFLSPYISLLIANICTAKQRQDILEKSHFEYLIMEDIVKFGLMKQVQREVQNEDWLVSNWLFYRNPPINKSLENSNKVTKANKVDFNLTGISVCEREVYFVAKYLHRDVKSLKSRTLYWSSKHNGALYDCMFINHNQKLVYVFQVSSLSPDKHSLSIYTVKDVMERLNLVENKEWKMKYFYCCSSNTKSQSGCQLDLSNDSRREVMNDAILKDLTSRLSIYIARIRFFPLENSYII